MAGVERLYVMPVTKAMPHISAAWQTGHYPERVLADQIYRNRKNCCYIKEHGWLKENDKAENNPVSQD